MKNEKTLKLLDAFGPIAESLGKELRGWSCLSEPFTKCHTARNYKLHSIACQGKQLCLELLNLHCKRVLSAMGGNTNRVLELGQNIAKLEREKEALRENFLEVFLDYIGYHRHGERNPQEQAKAKEGDIMIRVIPAGFLEAVARHRKERG